MKKILLPALALALIPFGTFAKPQRGIGFTGIGSEPRALSARHGSADYLGRSPSVPVALAGIPPRRVRVEPTDQAGLAKVAIENGGRVPSNAVEVGGDSQSLMLSTVDVNGTLFAVLRTPEGRSNGVNEAAGANFANAVPRLTGCLPGGNVYGTGRRSATGYAVPLNCR